MPDCTPHTGHVLGTDHRWQECPTYHDDNRADYGFDADGYYAPDTWYELPDGSGFVSPDGVGRYFYDTIDEAEDQHGTLPVRYVDELWDGNIPYTEEQA